MVLLIGSYLFLHVYFRFLATCMVKALAFKIIDLCTFVSSKSLG